MKLLCFNKTQSAGSNTPAPSHTYPRLQEIVDQEHDKSCFPQHIFSPTLYQPCVYMFLCWNQSLEFFFCWSSTRAFGLVILLVLQDAYWIWLDNKAQVHLHSTNFSNHKTLICIDLLYIDLKPIPTNLICHWFQDPFSFFKRTSLSWEQSEIFQSWEP